jgi:integrase
VPAGLTQKNRHPTGLGPSKLCIRKPLYGTSQQLCSCYPEKGGRQRKCQISKEGLKAIKDYIREERGNDAEMFPHSPALFLPADTVVRSSGRLTPAIVNRLWNDVCLSARVKGRTPHSARHAMGVHLVKKTGNPRTAQRQLGHKNPSTTMQYLQFTRKEMQEALDDR